MFACVSVFRGGSAARSHSRIGIRMSGIYFTKHPHMCIYAQIIHWGLFCTCIGYVNVIV